MVPGEDWNFARKALIAKVRVPGKSVRYPQTYPREKLGVL
jgi:hypothetical protein